MAVSGPSVPVVTAAPSVAGGLVREGAGGPAGREPAARGSRRGGAAPVLVSARSARLLSMQHAVEGNSAFIPFFHPVDFLSWDSMNVSSAGKNANVQSRQGMPMSHSCSTSPVL